MFSIPNTWGLPVEGLSETSRTTCPQVSTVTLPSPRRSLLASGKTQVIRTVAEVFPASFTQLFFSITHPLQLVVLHISTAPITTTKKKGLKK